jgi:hypothetical protein
VYEDANSKFSSKKQSESLYEEPNGEEVDNNVVILRTDSNEEIYEGKVLYKLVSEQLDNTAEKTIETKSNQRKFSVDGRQNNMIKNEVPSCRESTKSLELKETKPKDFEKKILKMEKERQIDIDSEKQQTVCCGFHRCLIV